MDIAGLQKDDQKRNMAQYFSNCNNADTLKMFVELQALI